MLDSLIRPLRRMRPNADSIGRLWQAACKVPGGKAAFSAFAARQAPYSASIGARVVELGPGHSRVEMADRPAVRNHLRSVHALALANLAEFASGLAMLAGLPAGRRGIVVRVEVDYLKKARGTVTAAADVVPPAADFDGPLVLPVELYDAGGDVVARGWFHWLIGPEVR